MDADIILLDHENDLVDIAPRLRKTKLFKNVYLVKSKNKNELKALLKSEGNVKDLFRGG